MTGEVFNSFEIEEIYLENEYQKVFLCKDKDKKMPFLVNAILDKNISQLLDVEELQKDNDIFIKTFNNENMLYIVTKFQNDILIKDFLRNKKVSLSTQMKCASLIIDKLKNISYYPSFIIKSIINHTNILIDDNGNIYFSGLLVIDKNSLETDKVEILKTLANTLSIIFIGKEILDKKIDNDIPPDIRKIIRKCIDNEYDDYNDILFDFRESKLYSLINLETQEAKKIHSVRKKLINKKRFFKFKKASIYILILLILVSPFLIKGIKGVYNNIKEVISDNNDELISDDPIDDNPIKDIDDIIDDKDEDANEIEEDDMNRYFDENEIDYSSEDYIGRIDSTQSYKGNSSIIVENFDEAEKEYFVGKIDLSEDRFNNIKQKEVDVSFWLKSDINQNSKITLKYFKDNEIYKSIDKDVYISNKSWTLQNISIKAEDEGFIKIYISTSNLSKVWIDTIEVDILK